MTLLETAAVAFAMFSAVPVPQPVWNEKKHAVRAVRLSAGGGCVRPCLVGLGGFGGAAFIPAFAARGRAVPCAGARDRGHPPGRLRRHLRCAGKLRRAGKKAGDIKATRTAARLRSYACAPILRPIWACARRWTARPGLCCAWGWALCWSGRFPAMRSRRSLWQKTRALPIPLQREQTARLCAARCLYCAHWPPQAWRRRGDDGRRHGAGCGACIFAIPRGGAKSSSAAYRATWPDGFCKRRSCGCWPRWQRAACFRG